MIEFLLAIFSILIWFFIFSILFADEVHISIKINDKQIIKYDRKEDIDKK